MYSAIIEPVFNPVFEPMSFKYKLNSRSQDKDKNFQGYLYTVKNHDGTTEMFILTDIMQSKISQNKIQFHVGVSIQTKNGNFIVDSLWIHPKEKSIVARVSPLAA